MKLTAEVQGHQNLKTIKKKCEIFTWLTGTAAGVLTRIK